MDKKKKISFKFEVFILILAIIFGGVVLWANFETPFLNQYIFVAIIILMAVSIASLITIFILINKINDNNIINR